MRVHRQGRKAPRWICNACRREGRGSGGRQGPDAAPAASLKHGAAALASPPPDDAVGNRVLAGLRAGRTAREIAEGLGVRVEMARYYVRRMSERAKPARLREAGLIALESRLGDALGILTDMQVEAVRIVLSGCSEREAGEQLGITQAAVSSRVRLGAKALRPRREPWARAIARGLAQVHRHRGARAFQLKPGSAGPRGPRIPRR